MQRPVHFYTRCAIVLDLNFMIQSKDQIPNCRAISFVWALTLPHPTTTHFNEICLQLNCDLILDNVRNWLPALPLETVPYVQAAWHVPRARRRTHALPTSQLVLFPLSLFFPASLSLVRLRQQLQLLLHGVVAVVIYAAVFPCSVKAKWTVWLFCKAPLSTQAMLGRKFSQPREDEPSSRALSRTRK